jgi:type IX secretion system PorP/SprF family membrane protein
MKCFVGTICLPLRRFLLGLLLKQPISIQKLDCSMHKTIRLSVLLAGILLAVSGAVQAQDKHFTQFYAAPIQLNPALTGAIEGRYRVGALYRDQWRSVLDAPIQSYAVQGDFRFNPFKRAVVKDAVGFGVQFVNDRIGIIDFNTTQIALAGAYHKSLGSDNKRFLSLGFSAGITQRTLTYSSLNFHDEFDGSTGFTLGTGEELPANNFAYVDMSTGLNYTAELNNNNNIFLGLAYHHFAQPNVSFLENQEEGDNLYRKLSVQMAGRFRVGSRQSRVALLPRVLVASQGPHLEVNAGTSVRTTLGEYGGSALHIGSWVRPVRNADGLGLDAVVALVGFEVNSVLLGLSYDLNLNALGYNQRRGAFELSVTYLGSFEDEGILCPKF